MSRNWTAVQLFSPAAIATPVPSRSRAIRREILRREDRLFEPVKIVGAQFQRHLPRLLGRPRAVGVDHERHAVARRVARGPNLGLFGLVQLDVAITLLDREPGARGNEFAVAELEQARIGGQRCLPGAAQQPMQGQVGGLAGDVPQCDVEARQGEDGDAVAAVQMQRLLQVVGEPPNVARVAADHPRHDHPVQHRPHRLHAAVAERIAPTNDAGIGLHLHQESVVAGPAREATRLAAEGEGNLDRERLDRGNLHAAAPFSRTSASSRSA